MKYNWGKIRLGDVCLTNINTYSSRDQWDFVHYLDTGNITSNCIDSIQHIDIKTEKLPSRAKRKVNYNNIIYSTVRPNQRHYGIIKEQPENFLVSTGFTVIEVDSDKVDADYLYFLLSSDSITESLSAIAEQSTSAYPSIKPSDIENLEILLPTLSEQKQIACILKALDDKIALNQQINKNLEEQAQAIYKAWFMDFEPFDGEMPSDWSFGTLEDLGNKIVCGKTPSTKRKEYYDGEIPFVTIPDMHNQIFITETERYLSNQGAESQPTKTLAKNSVCVSCIGTAGLVSLISRDSQTNQQINSITPKDGISPYYVYHLMKSLSETIRQLGASGSTIVNLNKSQFAKIEATIPSVEVMKSFDEALNPVFELILSNQQMNIRLSALRDTLLPRLISGEIDVSGIDIKP